MLALSVELMSPLKC